MLLCLRQDGLHLDEQVLQQVLAVPQPYKVIVTLREVEDADQPWGLSLDSQQPNSQFLVLSYALPGPDTQPDVPALRTMGMFTLLLSTFVIYEKRVPHHFQAYLPSLPCNREFLPTAYQITTLPHQYQAPQSVSSAPSCFQGVHEIYMTEPDYVAYIIKEFLLNSYQFKKLFQLSLENNHTFRELLLYVFKSVLKQSPQRLCDLRGVHSYLVIADQLEQYDNNISVYREGLDTPDEIDQVHQTLSQKCLLSLEKHLDDPQLPAAQERLRRKLQKAFQRVFSPPEDDQNEQQEFEEFGALLSKEFGILQEKMQQQQYGSYEAYEADLQIFINFCFDNLLDKPATQNPRQVEQGLFVRIKMIYQFVYAQNTQGALFFLGQKTGIFRESMVNLASVDDLTLLDPDMRRSNCFQQELECNLKDQQSSIEKVREHLDRLEGTEDIETEQIVSNLKMELGELESTQRHMTSNLKSVTQQVQKYRRAVKQAKLAVFPQKENNEKYFYERVLELESEIEESRQRQEHQEQLHSTRENSQRQQIEELKDKVNRLYSKSINESRSEITKSDIHQDLQHSNKVAMLEGKMSAMQQENENKFNQIRTLKVEKEKERGQMQQRIAQLEMQEQEGGQRAGDLQSQVQKLQHALEQQQQQYESTLLNRSDGKLDIYKQMNQKLEEENERLRGDVSEANEMLGAQQAQLEEYQKGDQQNQSSIQQLREELEEFGQQVSYGQQDREALEQQCRLEVSRVREQTEEQLQELRRAMGEQREGYERRITKIKRQITQHNPFIVEDRPAPFSNQESTYEPSGGLNNSLFNLIQPQRPSDKNAYELKIQEYQSKVQGMVEEKTQLIERIDEIYSKYLDQHILQNQHQTYKESELQGHIENLKQKLKQEIDGRHGLSPSRLESSILRQMNSNSMLQRPGSANSHGKGGSLLKRSALGSQANMENSLLNTYLDSNQLKTASRISLITKPSQIISRPEPPGSKLSFQSRAVTNPSEIYSRPSLLPKSQHASSLYHKLSKGLKWDSAQPNPSRSKVSLNGSQHRSFLQNTTYKSSSRMLFTNL